MQNIERRIEALETRVALNEKPLKVLLRAETEPEADAMARAGYTEDDNVMHVVLVAVPPRYQRTDEPHQG